MGDVSEVGEGQVWVPAHWRGGVRVEGYYRRKGAGPAAVADGEGAQGPHGEVGALVYPPMSGRPGHQRPSSTWLSETATNDAALIQQLQAALATQRDITDARELTLAYSPVLKSKTLLAGSINDVRIIELASGQRAFHKSIFGGDSEISADYGLEHEGEQALHEVAAWRVAKIMGGPWREITAPTVIREVESEVGSSSLEMPGGMESSAAPRRADAWAAAGLFDAVIGNQDRHENNYLRRKDGGISLIDHGLAFRRPGDFLNFSTLQRDRVASSPELRDHERDALHRIQSDSTLGGVVTFLPPRSGRRPACSSGPHAG